MPQKTQYYRMPRWEYYKYAPPAVITGPPTVIDVPYMTGPGTVGSVHNCTMGNWTQTPSSYAYQWLRDGANIAGATNNTYTTVSADNGTNIACKVTATNSFGSSSSTSNSIAIATTELDENQTQQASNMF